MSVALIKVRAACARFGLLRGVRRVAVADSGAVGEMLLEALTALGRDGGFAVLSLKAAGGRLDELCAAAATLGCDALALPDTLDDAIDARYLCAGKPDGAVSPVEKRGALLLIRPLILTRADELGLEAGLSSRKASAARSLDSASGYSAIYPETERAIRRAFNQAIEEINKNG